MSKVRKQFILDDLKIKKAKKILGVTTDTEAVDQALDLVITNTKLYDLHKRLSGKLKIENMDQSSFNE